MAMSYAGLISLGISDVGFEPADTKFDGAVDDGAGDVTADNKIAEAGMTEGVSVDGAADDNEADEDFATKSCGGFSLDSVRSEPAAPGTATTEVFGCFGFAFFSLDGPSAMPICFGIFGQPVFP